MVVGPIPVPVLVMVVYGALGKISVLVLGGISHMP